MQDSFDDFEIKPITEGLGFHKKAVKLNETTKQSGLVSEKLNSNVPFSPPESFFENSESENEPTSRSAKESLDKVLESLNLNSQSLSAKSKLDILEDNEVEITMPLQGYPSNDIFSKSNKTSNKASTDIFVKTEIETPKPSRPVITEQLPISPSKKVVDPMVIGTKRGGHDSFASNLKPISISLPSIILDGVVVLALSLVFLVSLLSVTKVEVLSVAFNAQTDIATQLSLLVLYVAIMQTYAVISRSFFGRTLGEWTFDCQMGDDQQHKSGWYPIWVGWRSVLIIATGVVLLPLLSLLFRKDLLAPLSKLQLYQKI